MKHLSADAVKNVQDVSNNYNAGMEIDNSDEYLNQTVNSFTGFHGQPTWQQELTRFINLSYSEQLVEITDWANGCNITDQTPEEILDDIQNTI